MTPQELAAGVQYTIDSNHEVMAVVVPPVLWRKILDELAESQRRELAAMLLERAPQRPVDLSSLGLPGLNEDFA